MGEVLFIFFQFVSHLGIPLGILLFVLLVIGALNQSKKDDAHGDKTENNTNKVESAEYNNSSTRKEKHIGQINRELVDKIKNNILDMTAIHKAIKNDFKLCSEAEINVLKRECGDGVINSIN